MRRFVLPVVAAGMLMFVGSAAAAERSAWPAYGHDTQLTNHVASTSITARSARGLRLAWGTQLDGRLYVPVASYCDEPDPDGLAAQGRLVAVDPDTARPLATLQTVPGTGTLGGLWGWGGVATDLYGSTLYTGVGNSYVRDEQCG